MPGFPPSVWDHRIIVKLISLVQDSEIALIFLKIHSFNKERKQCILFISKIFTSLFCCYNGREIVIQGHEAGLAFPEKT